MSQAEVTESQRTVDELLPTRLVEKATGLERQTLVRLPGFPRFVVLSIRADGRPAKIAWLKSEVDAWILARAAQRKPTQAPTEPA
ncbi:hypothetical protein I5S86_15845 [Priestia aryabhattai]|nr:hypothetical protein I5S86_15845 [Priestia aryabhattai]